MVILYWIAPFSYENNYAPMSTAYDILMLIRILLWNASWKIWKRLPAIEEQVIIRFIAINQSVDIPKLDYKE